MNFIKYGDYNFHGDSETYGKDGLFMSGSVEQSVAPFGNELSADSLTFVVNSRALQGDGTGYAFLLDINERPIQTSDGKYLVVRNVFPDYRNFKAGAVLDLYNNPHGNIIGRFYVEDVTQVSKKTVKFTCTDCIGVLQKMNDYGGGVWKRNDNKTAKSIIDEIMAGSGIQYNVQSSVGNVLCIGRLQRENRRVSLGRLLVATGASLVENKGIVEIKYLGSGTRPTLPTSSVYLDGGAVSYMHPATSVEVTEHAFYELQSDEEVTLFDNTDDQIAVINQLVVFDNPVHNITPTGSITISEGNANYAIISGIGTLTGQVYTHTTRVLSRATGINAAPNVIRMEDNELVGTHNSVNVAKRMINRYKLSMAISYDQLDPSNALGSFAAGTPLNVVDPFGTFRSGWISKKTFEIANKTKSRMNVLVDFVTGPYGSTYTTATEFTELDIVNGRLTFSPSLVGREALIILIGGGGGGQGGYNGQDGEAPSGLENYNNYAVGHGGAGGNGGKGGERPKVFSFQVSSLPAYYDGVSIGQGGAGGASNGGLGSAGTATTLGGYSSADGVPLIDTLVNFITGVEYGKLGEDGKSGGKGGDGSGRGTTYLDTSTKGEDIYDELHGRLSHGGNYFNGSTYDYKIGSNSRVYRQTGGAGGGGASARQDGESGYSSWDYETEEYRDGSWGGAGGSFDNLVTQALRTNGGQGGHGGGGGGGAAQCYRHVDGSSVFSYGQNHGGAGGAGQQGQTGGNGLILMYYSE